MKELYPELIDYIFKYCGEYRSKIEDKALNHHIATLKFGDRNHLHPKLMELKQRSITADQKVLNLLKDGYPEFVKNTAIRIYKTYKNQLEFNLCPKCGKIARTPKAKQCRFCSYNWH